MSLKVNFKKKQGNDGNDVNLAVRDSFQTPEMQIQKDVDTLMVLVQGVCCPAKGSPPSAWPWMPCCPPLPQEPQPPRPSASSAGSCGLTIHSQQVHPRINTMMHEDDGNMAVVHAICREVYALSVRGGELVGALAVSIGGDVHNPLSQVLILALFPDLHVPDMSLRPASTL